MKELHKKASRLFSLCMSLIALYIIAVLVYALATFGSVSGELILFEMLHSVAISALLSLGGALLLDAELKRH